MFMHLWDHTTGTPIAVVTRCNWRPTQYNRPASYMLSHLFYNYAWVAKKPVRRLSPNTKLRSAYN
jgi:hypothetical protein